MKCSYLRSWPGFLAGAELLLGGMAVACVIAYVQRDSEWSSSYELYYGESDAAGYRGPMTPFVLAVVGLSWAVTLVSESIYVAERSYWNMSYRFL